MYNINEIKECLRDQVGFRQVIRTELGTYSEDVVTSESGLFVQDAHKLLTDDNIDYAIPNFTDIDPVNAVTLRNEYLQQLKVEAVNDVVHRMVHEGKVAKTINEKFTIHDATPNYRSLRPKLNDKFVGFIVRPKQMQGLTAQINKIGYLGNTDNQQIDVLIFHTSNLIDPVATINLNNNDARKFKWQDVTRELPYLGENETGGEYIIGYYTNDVAGTSFSTYYSFRKIPCKKCVGATRYNNWNLRNKYIDVEPTQFDLLEDGTIDYESAQYVHNTTFGLNIDFSATCNITEIICSQRSVFAKAIQNQIAIALLKTFAYSTRDNSLSLEVKQMAMTELIGMPDTNMQGLLSMQDELIKSLQLDFSGLDSACLPCRDKVRTGRA